MKEKGRKNNHDIGSGKRSRAGRIALIAGAMTLGQTLLTTASAVSPTVEPQLISPLPGGYMSRGAEMEKDGNYAGAMDQIAMTDREGMTPSEREEAAFKLARLNYLNGDEYCVALLDKFVMQYPASAHTLEARLLAGDYYFFKHDFGEAVERYKQIDMSALGASDRKEYQFREALSLTRCGYYDEAARLFCGLKGNSRFGTAATYYIAYIDYVLGDYDSAKRGFLSLPEDVSRGTASRRGNRDYVSEGMEPGYYLTQIDYLHQDYDAVIRNGRSLLAKKPVKELIPETLRVIGESYYKKGDMPTARQYLEDYLDYGLENSEPTARYALGTILYEEGEYEKAAQLFSTLTDLNNVLAQSGWLYLGQCRVQEGDDRGAAIAFERAYRLKYSDRLCETALYDYATALMRGGNVPFSSSAAALERFLTQYPRSTYAPKVRAILGAAYARQGDYSKALSYLEKIDSPDTKTLTLKQKVLFELGCEEVSTGQFKEAERHLAESSRMKQDGTISRQSLLWLGDARYAQKEYRRAEEAYRSFLKGGRNEENYELGTYNLGYALYQQDKFAEAATYFAQAARGNGRQAENARLREADCLFYSRDYSGAKKVYEQIIDRNGAGADYATLRHATIRGLLGDIPGKLVELESLKRKYPGTNYDAAALLEMGVTLSDQGRIKEAQTKYRELADKYSDRPEARKALLNLALSSMNAGDTDQAAETYMEIIKRWPTSQEAEVANEDLSGIHASRGTLKEYAAWLESVPGAPSISVSEIEQLTFNAAADAYAKDATDTRLLEKYAAEYPDGANLSKALLYIAEGKYESGDYKNALKRAEELLSKRPDSPQAAEALAMAGEIHENHDKSANAKREAYRNYKSLLSKSDDYTSEALAGMMRTSENADEQVKLARRLLELGGDAETTEQAYYYEATGLLKSEPKAAVEKLKKLAANPKSERGAMAAVKLGQYYIDTKQYGSAERVLQSFTDSGSPHDYWIARGFIALADTYSAQGKDYLAKEYLISLRDNYPGDEADIMKMIAERLK